MNAVKDDVIKLVEKELESANKQFPQFRSEHEGYAIIKEEVEEAEDDMNWINNTCLEVIWKMIKANETPIYHVRHLRECAINLATEAIQIAAMAQKFIDSQNGGES